MKFGQQIRAHRRQPKQCDHVQAYIDYKLIKRQLRVQPTPSNFESMVRQQIVAVNAHVATIVAKFEFLGETDCDEAKESLRTSTASFIEVSAIGLRKLAKKFDKQRCEQMHEPLMLRWLTQEPFCTTHYAACHSISVIIHPPRDHSHEGFLRLLHLIASCGSALADERPSVDDGLLIDRVLAAAGDVSRWLDTPQSSAPPVEAVLAIMFALSSGASGSQWHHHRLMQYLTTMVDELAAQKISLCLGTSLEHAELDRERHRAIVEACVAVLRRARRAHALAACCPRCGRAHSGSCDMEEWTPVLVD
jgi:hypothetical protein